MAKNFEYRGSEKNILGEFANESIIKKFDFFVADDKANEFHSQQARVTFVIEAEIKGGKNIHKQNIKIQTTVSSRYYE